LEAVLILKMSPSFGNSSSELSKLRNMSLTSEYLSKDTTYAHGFGQANILEQIIPKKMQYLLVIYPLP